MSTFSPKIQRLADRLNKVSKSFKTKEGVTVKACCPAHDDHTPSLALTEKAGQWPLIKCFSGCKNDDILAAVGLEWTDILPDRKLTTGLHYKTGHDYRSLCQIAHTTTVEIVLLAHHILEIAKIGQSVEDIGVQLMHRAAKIEGISEELRRAS